MTQKNAIVEKSKSSASDIVSRTVLFYMLSAFFLVLLFTIIFKEQIDLFKVWVKGDTLGTLFLFVLCFLIFLLMLLLFISIRKRVAGSKLFSSSIKVHLFAVFFTSLFLALFIGLLALVVTNENEYNHVSDLRLSLSSIISFSYIGIVLGICLPVFFVYDAILKKFKCNSYK